MIATLDDPTTLDTTEEEGAVAVAQPKRLRINKEVMKATYRSRNPVQMAVTFSGECDGGANCSNTLSCMTECGTWEGSCGDCSCGSSFIVCCSIT